MTVVTVPLDAEMEKFIKECVRSGDSENKASVVRKALMAYRRQKAYEGLRESEADIAAGRVYSGDLDDLAAKIGN